MKESMPSRSSEYRVPWRELPSNDVIVDRTKELLDEFVAGVKENGGVTRLDAVLGAERYLAERGLPDVSVLIDRQHQVLVSFKSPVDQQTLSFTYQPRV